MDACAVLNPTFFFQPWISRIIRTFDRITSSSKISHCIVIFFFFFFFSTYRQTTKEKMSSSTKQDTNLPPSYGSLTPVQTNAVRICSISLTGRDKIRLIGTPTALSPLVRSSILSSWGTIRKESNYAGSHEFKLSGSPWRSQGPDAVRSRRLLNGILYTMAKAGWDLVQATDVSQRERDKDTLFFEYTESLSDHGGGGSSLLSSCSASMASTGGLPALPGVGTSRSGSLRVGSSSGMGIGSGSVRRDGYGEDGLREVELFAVSFNRSDRIRVISQQPPQVASRMMELIKQAVASQWKYG